jgi:hypothetical protein
MMNIKRRINEMFEILKDIDKKIKITNKLIK